jgi:tetratricopeptide (TPR) repeat protein
METASHSKETIIEVELFKKQINALKELLELQVTVANIKTEQENHGEAETHYRQALSLKIDLAVAYNNLGYVLTDQGQHNDAVINCQYAILLNPDFAEAHHTLGIALSRQRKLDEAAASFQKAIFLNPELKESHKNLGIVLSIQGKFDDAAVYCQHAISLDPNSAEAHYVLGSILGRQGKLDDALKSYKKVISINPGNADAHVSMAIIYWLKEDLSDLAKSIESSNNVGDLATHSADFVVPYRKFLSNLLVYKKRRQDLYSNSKQLPVLYVVGDSHSLSASNIVVKLNGVEHRMQSKIIVGCKAWHLANNSDNQYKCQLELISKTIPDGATVIVIFGEIDCRINTGIIKHHRKTNNDLSETIKKLAQDYVSFVTGIFSNRSVKIIFSGIPAIPDFNNRLSTEDKVIWSKSIDLINSSIKTEAAKKNCKNLDLYSLTRKSDNRDFEDCFIDEYHINPLIFVNAVSQIGASGEKAVNI